MDLTDSIALTSDLLRLTHPFHAHLSGFEGDTDLSNAEQHELKVPYLLSDPDQIEQMARLIDQAAMQGFTVREDYSTKMKFYSAGVSLSASALDEQAAREFFGQPAVDSQQVPTRFTFKANCSPIIERGIGLVAAKLGPDFAAGILTPVAKSRLSAVGMLPGYMLELENGMLPNHSVKIGGKALEVSVNGDFDLSAPGFRDTVHTNATLKGLPTRLPPNLVVEAQGKGFECFLKPGEKIDFKRNWPSAKPDEGRVGVIVSVKSNIVSQRSNAASIRDIFRGTGLVQRGAFKELVIEPRNVPVQNSKAVGGVSTGARGVLQYLESSLPRLGSKFKIATGMAATRA